MSPDRLKWLRDDDTDERLVNPIADMVRIFSHYESDRGEIIQKQGKAQILERSTEFTSSLLKLSEELNKLDVMSRIFTDNKPSKQEIQKHELLVRQRLQLTETFVVSKFGSTEKFLLWWEEN